MKTVFHKSENRGNANHGWLNAHHTFSFANYYNPEMMNFGVLRVLNDDIVSGGMGFSEHPHKDMEIITIPLEGALKHRDSMENEGVIANGEVQVMSAGTGIFHSEKNANYDRDVKLLQIWIFPKLLHVKPRYDQISYDSNLKNQFQQIVSPNSEDEGTWIHQDSWFFLSKFTEGFSTEYHLKKEGNGVYIFVIKGSVKIGDQILNSRDGFGIWEVNSFSINSLADAEILFMEVPMNLPEYLMN